MSSLAKGLESRWSYTDSYDDESKEFYTTAIKSVNIAISHSKIVNYKKKLLLISIH